MAGQRRHAGRWPRRPQCQGRLCVGLAALPRRPAWLSASHRLSGGCGLPLAERLEIGEDRHLRAFQQEADRLPRRCFAAVSIIGLRFFLPAGAPEPTPERGVPATGARRSRYCDRWYRALQQRDGRMAADGSISRRAPGPADRISLPGNQTPGGHRWPAWSIPASCSRKQRRRRSFPAHARSVARSLPCSR